MCGIVGTASSERRSPSDRAWLAVGRDAMGHRGPDDAGEWWSGDGRVGLAHRRLAIIDLTQAGHQPMQDSAGTLTIVFNGEIYNFVDLRNELCAAGAVIRSQSDTEVILAAYRRWGTECVKRLNGMFCFAIHDAEKQTVLLARDRAGEKPLFYRHEESTIRFASELKALLADTTLPRQIEPEALDCYLAMGYVPGERCILRGFNKLPPAHALEFDLRSGTARSWRYWNVPAPPENGALASVDESELLNELESLLEDAVRRQLVADVPVGVLLSGGVDSSIITAMAVRASHRVRTFTVGFEGHGLHDEREHARLIARHFGTQHTELVAEPATADLLSKLARQFDEPIVDSSMIPTYLVSQLVRQQCTVALGGDGGDELFGGYSEYSRLLWLQGRTRPIPRPVRRAVSSAAEKLLPVGFKGRNWLAALGTDYRAGVPLIASYFGLRARHDLLPGWGSARGAAEAVLKQRTPVHPDLLQRATRMDFQNYLAEDILVKVDRASMLHSLEVRAPFLDYRVIEFAFGRVPSTLKANARTKKILLKRLTTRVLPPGFDQERKQGFSIPLADWLRGGSFRTLFHDVLLDPQSVFDARAVQDLLRCQERGRNNGERLFALVLFELWRRAYGIVL